MQIFSTATPRKSKKKRYPPPQTEINLNVWPKIRNCSLQGVIK